MLLLSDLLKDDLLGLRLFALVLIGVGVYSLVRRDAAAKAGARAHRWQAKWFPWMYWIPGSKKLFASEAFWRVLAPLMAVFLIGGGILALFFPSGFSY
jgi:hypothetical protein